MKNKHIAVLLIIAAIIASMLAATGCAPTITHTLEGHDDCLACHNENGAKPYPDGHAKRGRTNDTCSTCHQPQD